jgi:hypothetical protein
MSKKNGSKEKPLDAKQDKVQAKYIFTSDELINAVIKEGGAA